MTFFTQEKGTLLPERALCYWSLGPGTKLGGPGPPGSYAAAYYIPGTRTQVQKVKPSKMVETEELQSNYLTQSFLLLLSVGSVPEFCILILI